MMIINNYDSNHIRVLHMILEKGMATLSNILAWRTPRTEEPGGLQSMGSQRVRHDWATSTHTCTWWQNREMLGTGGEERERDTDIYYGILQAQNLVVKAGRLEVEWRAAVWAQRESVGRIPSCSLCSSKAFNCVNDAHAHYAGEGALLKVHQFQCFFQPKTIVIETFRMFDQISGYRGQAKLTHKINHHSNQPSLNVLWMLVLSEYYFKCLINSIP